MSHTQNMHGQSHTARAILESTVRGTQERPHITEKGPDCCKPSILNAGPATSAQGSCKSQGSLTDLEVRSAVLVMLLAARMNSCFMHLT